ncbi:hypothetical protein BDV93DRAFT_611032 [Ceratobasidium sp. AG-I]|nr:hypothetical protein BDV93DRAFT_611032 [Ceratobasidium sp. AG-I]
MEEAGTERHQRWGESLASYPDTFLATVQRHEARQESYDTSELQIAVKELQKYTEYLPGSVLERLLLFSQTSRNIEHLLVPDIIPGIMEILETYCEQNKIFSYYYGFLCVQLLTRAFEVGVMDGFNSRNRFSDSRFAKTGQGDLAHSMANFVARTLQGSLVLFNGNGMSTILRRSLNPRGNACLLHLGGFHDSDAEFLLDRLWEDRKAFMVLCNRVEIPGWSILLAVIWEQIRYFERPDLQCKMIKSLLLRYILVSSRQECALAYHIIREIDRALPSRDDRVFKFPPVDVDDARNILAAFMKYLHTTQDSREMFEMMTLPFSAVYHTASVYLQDEVAPLLEAVLNRTWRIMEEEQLTAQERMLSAFEYAGSALATFGFVFKGVARPGLYDDISMLSCIRLLAHTDFIELMGRLCAALVTPANDNSRGIFLVSEDQWQKFEMGLQLLLDQLREDTDHWDSSDLAMVESCYEMWARVRRYINLQIDLYVATGPVGDRFKACQNVWLNFGEAFGYDKLEANEENRQCMYPRCANPYPDGGARVVCGRCCWVHYCSVECQTAHWLFNSPDSHRRRCIHINGQWSYVN